MQYHTPDGQEQPKKDGPPPEEIEAFMLVDKDGGQNVLKSVGFTTTGNPRFIFFSEKEAKRFLLGEPKVKARFELAKVLVKVIR